MRPVPKSMLFALLALTLFSTVVFASTIPLKNWTPAPFGSSEASKSGPRLNLTTNTQSASFIPLAPCRVYDSRTSPPATQLAAGTSRTINVDGGPCSGIPSNAAAYSLSVTAFSSVSNGTYAFITLYPTGTTRPTTSTMNFLTGSQSSNAATVAVGTAGDIDIYTTYTTDFVLDINGYFTVNQLAGNGFQSVATTAVGVEGDSTSNYGVVGSSTNSYGVVGFSSGGTGVAAVAGSATDAKGVYGISQNYNGMWAQSTSWDGLAAFGGRDGSYSQGARNGAVAVSTGTSGVLYGVIASSASTTASAAGGNFADHTGGVVNGVSTPFHNSTAGVVGNSRGGLGVLGIVDGSPWAAVAGSVMDSASPFAELTSGNLGWTSTTAGFFKGDVFIVAGPTSSGNLSVSGTLSKGAGTFKIDDPLDPENKYLYHSFVESPDMMNVYNGMIELDNDGNATVNLPEYFQALNKDFRYQLTAVGSRQPGLYVDQEVANNSFVISGGKAHGKVSWQVTGIRQDPFANAHRVIPEVAKEPEMRGTYLHPVELGHQMSEGETAKELQLRAEAQERARQASPK